MQHMFVRTLMRTSLQATRSLHGNVTLRLEHLLSEIVILQLLAHKGERRAVELGHGLVIASLLQLVQVVALCGHFAASLLLNDVSL